MSEPQLSRRSGGRAAVGIALICIGGLILLPIALGGLCTAVVNAGPLPVLLWVPISILAGIGLLGWGFRLPPSRRRVRLLFGGALLMFLPPGVLFWFLVVTLATWNVHGVDVGDVVLSTVLIGVLTVVGALALIYWGVKLHRR